jgi:hypothetical protein
MLWWFGHPDTREAWHAFLGLLMAAWLLVPSRQGWLRWLVPLAALEVLYLSINAPSAATGRAAARMLLPIALGALAGDAWLIATSGARSSARSPPPLWAVLRWAAVPALIAVLAGMWSGHVLTMSERPAAQNARSASGPSLPISDRQTSKLNQPVIGEPGRIDLDPMVAARLYRDDAPLPGGVVYLRDTAFDLVVTDGEKVEWQSPDPLDQPPVAALEPQPEHGCTVFRAPSDTDSVLHPDDGTAVALDGLIRDREGNLYRTGIGEGPRVYRCSIGDGPQPAPADRTPYLALPSHMSGFPQDDFPWDDIEAGQPWRSMSPEEAADAIRSAIQERCSYKLTIPVPEHRTGGALRTFLFSKDKALRVGHCQFFATAEALLLRHTGHPARLVDGYASSEHDEEGVTFRAMHAHAWVEFINSQGDWQRIDPTPAEDMQKPLLEAMRDQPLPPPPPIDPASVEKPALAQASPIKVVQRHYLAVPLLAGAFIAVVIIVLVRRSLARPWRDPRLASLERRADDLFGFARSLGIAIGPATTLSSVTTELERRCQMDLSRYRDAHLAARYGTGSLPLPWPYAEMRAAAKSAARQGAGATQDAPAPRTGTGTGTERSRRGSRPGP